MHSKALTVFSAIGLVSALGFSLGDAIAANGSKAFCNDYTNKAIKQQQQNTNQGCGFSGNAWSTSRSWHFDWCRRVDTGLAAQGNSFRVNKLSNECKTQTSNISKESFCRQYTADAIYDNNLNKSQGCGHTGPRWNSNYAHHYNWCLTADRRLATQEQKARTLKAQNSC